MRPHVRRITAWVSFLLFIGNPVAYSAEGLIAPTRSLGGSAEAPGILNVASEPPGLTVYLDGSEIGGTPVWRRAVKPGVHTLQVGELQADIHLAPGQTKTLSAFQGSLIEVPKVRKVEPQVAPEPEVRPSGRKDLKPPEEEKGGDLTPWERFLNGTSPSF